LEIGDWHEVPDFQLPLAHDGQGRRLHAANADDAPRPLTRMTVAVRVSDRL
jgi:hypothetical protein